MRSGVPISHSVGPSLGGSNTRLPKSISKPVFAQVIHIRQCMNQMRTYKGQNGHIPLFSNISLFAKYLAIYHLFETRVCET